MSLRRTTIAILSLGFVAFQVYIALGGIVGDIPMRIFHICFAVALASLFYPLPSDKVLARLADWALVLIPLVVAGYTLLNHSRIDSRISLVDPLTTGDLVLGVLLVVALMETGRRVAGNGLTIIVLVFVVYGFYGYIFPGLLRHAGVSVNQFVDNNFLFTGGMLGIPTMVSVQYVFYFVLFGAFLRACGGGQLLMDVAMRLTGRSLGGPAKTAVIASGLMGSVSGSAVANVAGTGVMTIPLMKQVGYKPKFAAAVEAIASTGGQLMPPVMGAAAFILAEMTRVPYVTICKAAILPAIVYYASLLAVVHFRAAAVGLESLTGKDMGQLSQRIARRLYMGLPILVLVYYIATGSSLMTAALRSTVVALVVSLLSRATRPDLKKLMEIAQQTAKGATAVAIPCAAAGIIIGTVSMSGLGLKLTDLLLGITGGQLIPTLLLVIVAAIVLGMGMPTSAAYIMAAVLMAPALVNLGLEVIPAHMFIFYFAILSMVTPPVALATYTAAGIAESNASETGWEAFRLALPGFLIPFVFILNPAFLMQGSSTVETLLVFGTAMLGVIAMAASLVGWFNGRLAVWKRAVLFGAALLMLVPEHATDWVGLLAIAVIYWWQGWGSKRGARQANQAG